MLQHLLANFANFCFQRNFSSRILAHMHQLVILKWFHPIILSSSFRDHDVQFLYTLMVYCSTIEMRVGSILYYKKKLKRLLKAL